MYMSQMTFSPVHLVRNGIYEQHQALWRVFSDDPDRKRDFLYRDMGHNSFLVVSAREPRQVDLLERLQVKRYEPRLAMGDRLHFSLRVNPVVKQSYDKPDGKRGQRRIDLVQNKRVRLLEEGVKRAKLPNRNVLAEEASRDWLLPRAEHMGMDIEPERIMVEAYNRFSFRKSAKKPVVLSCIDLRGFGTVTDPKRLEETLYNGIGCAKGFGFGLMLVRRAGCFPG